jgi:NADPH:quinone reductase-like Zn-dependent oxidoreductase/acyl carrier protein
VEDGARVVALRSKALVALSGRGGMVSVAEPADAARERIARWGERLSVAAVNGPEATVICGELADLDELVAACAAAGVRARVLPVDYASHSTQVERLREEILADLAPVTPGPAVIPMVSAMTGAWLDGPEADAGYWYDSLRAPVEFGRAVAALADAGHRVFVEVSPHPVLAGAMADDARVVAGTLRRDDGGAGRFLASLASLHVLGVRVGWAAVLGGGRRTELPTYAFRHERFWPRSAPAARAAGAAALGLSAVSHPLLGAAVELAGAEGLVLTGLMSVRSQPWLADHTVAGVTVLPGTAFADMAIAAGNAAGCGMVDELTVQAPLILPAEGAVRVQVTVSGPGPGGRRAVEVYARPADAAGPWTRHASGWLGRDSQPAGLAGEFAVWPPPGAVLAETAGLYEALSADGYAYGPSFRGLRAVWRRGEDLFAEAALPAGADPAGFGVHPALLDAVLHAAGLHAAGLHAAGLPAAGRAGDAARPGEVMLPFAWHGVSVHAPGAPVLRARLSPAAAGGWSLAAADGAGTPVMSVASLALRPVATAELAAVRGGVRDALFAVDWVPVPAAGGVLAGLRAAVVGAPGPGLAGVAAGLAGAGAHVRGHQDLAALAGRVRSGEPLPEVVLACTGTGAGTAVAGWSAAGGGTVAGGGAAAARAEAGRVLELIQRWLGLGPLSSAQLVLVTQGAVAAMPGEGVADLAGAAVWGLVRSAQSENPGRLVLADLPAGTAETESGETYRVLAAAIGSGEPEIAIRDRMAYGRRLARASGGLRPPAAGPWRLEAVRPGTLDGLALAACEQAAGPLETGQVRVAVRAAGLNFRDVLISVDMYPGVAVMGSEIAGVVLETGPGVPGLEVGDRVLGLASGGFGPLAVADARLLAPVPPGWSFAQAAAVPMAFVTAWHALTDLAAARPGQKLLVQAAAGGVGTAAVTIARHLGLEVYATAAPGKHAVLASMGLDRAHIASSRSAEFEPWFQAVTGEAGVDIVLNSLAGDLADASLRLLPRGGAFVELGKAGLRDPAAVAAEYPGVSYRPLDLSAAGPARLGQILAQVTGLLAAGKLTLPPVRAWDVRRAPEGLRFMSQARHVGKLVLTIPPDPAAPREAGAVLVTGGTGMLGGLVAGHLAATGRAGALVLASRSGPVAPRVADLAADLAGHGAAVQVIACDVADRAALAALLARIPADRPLTGVMHAAGVLDDGVTESLTPARVEAVLRPKADAAWHLHELTAGLDLQAFVLFSSVAATVGAAGQGSYVAANTFLDALASHRRAAGLPALSLAWGAWVHRAGIGRNLGEDQLSRISRSGMAELSAEEGLALLDAALSRDEALLVPARIDLAGLRLRGAGLHPLWRGLVPEIPQIPQAPDVPEGALAAENPWAAGLDRHPATSGLDRHTASAGAEGLRRQLAGMPGSDRDKLLVDLVRAHAAAVIGHATADPVEPGRPFRELGFDSLTAVELRNRLNAATGLQLPATLIFDYPTPAELGGYLRARTADQEPEGPPALAELDRLEAVLSRLAVSGDERSRILTRLEALVQDVRAGTTDSVSAYRELDEATDEEMFDLIDEELGI